MMNKYLIIFILLLGSIQSCQKDPKSTLETKNTTMVMDFGANSSSISTELQSAIDNIRIYLFDTGDGLLKTEIFDIKQSNGKLEFRAPVGTWDIIGVSNLEATPFDINVKHGHSREQLLYQYTYSQTGLGVNKDGDIGANAQEIVMFEILNKTITEATVGEVSAKFKRMVGKVTVAIGGFDGEVDIDGTHSIEITGVPTTISHRGGLLDASFTHQRKNPQTFSAENRFVRKLTISPNLATNPEDAQNHKVTFIIPAWYNYEAGDSKNEGNNPIGLKLKVELGRGNFYESTLAPGIMPKTLAANRELYIKINASTTPKFEAAISDWSLENIDGSTNSSELISPNNITLDWAKLGRSFSTQPLLIKGSGDIAIFDQVKGSKDKYTKIEFNPTPNTTPAFISRTNMPSWLESISYTVVDAKEVNLTFTYKLDNSKNKDKYYMKFTSGNITKYLVAEYDNGYFSPEIMNGELGDTYFEVIDPTSTSTTSSRNGWAPNGIQLSLEDDYVVTSQAGRPPVSYMGNPFTEEYNFLSGQAPRRSVNTSNRSNKKLVSFAFNRGLVNTHIMDNTYEAANLCKGTQGNFYLPSVSELNWIYKHRDYLGYSYRFIDLNHNEHYWTSSEVASEPTKNWAIYFYAPVTTIATVKSKSMRTRCITNM